MSFEQKNELGAGAWRTSPIMVIARHYARESKFIILSILVLTTCASLSAVAAPYLFSRIVDKLASEAAADHLLIGFAPYAILMGANFALREVADYMSHMSAQNLSFIAGTEFFQRIVKKDSRFFVEHNPAEI